MKIFELNAYLIFSQMLISYYKDNFYFKASCDPMEPSGGPGGENFGMLARFPVLVN